ncbi:MAG: hypothetical protein ABS88_10715 [Sphingopyxis sp. SCN 67-31]|nr:MAG: hypothetical protein ABS88_10715 [Sphingopyxis sp. SCN 67-31]
MSDEAGGGAAAEIAGGGAEQPGGGGATPEWLGRLPDDLKGDVNLTRYADVEALARGHLEARSKLGAPKLPTADTAIDNFEMFHAARPADAAAYEISVPDGYDAQFGDGFRALAHEIGLHPSQAKKIVDFNNSAVAGQLQAAQDAAKAEVDSFKTELTSKGGDYQAQLNSVTAMLEKHGLGDPDETMKAVEGIEAQLGASRTLKLLFGLAQGFGEPATPPADGGSGAPSPANLDSMTIDQVRAVRQEKMANPEWVKKANTAGTQENREYNNFIAAEARAVERARRG